MSESKQAASFEDLEQAEDTQYEFVEGVYGTTIEIGSLSSESLLEWIEDNEDKEKSKFGGLRLLVRSLISRKSGKPERVGPADSEAFAKMIKTLAGKSTVSNNKAIKACFALNGIDKMIKGGPQVPNVSSEAVTGDSPSDSPSPSEK